MVVVIGVILVWGMCWYVIGNGLVNEWLLSMLWIWVVLIGVVVMVLILGWCSVWWWCCGVLLLVVFFCLFSVILMFNLWVGYFLIV